MADYERRITKSFLVGSFAISFSLVNEVGFAQQTDPAVEQEAQALLESAVELMQAKKFPPACRKLEVVLQRLPQATGARLELARCYRGEGRAASAWRQYVQVEDLARRAGQKARAAEASKNATELARIIGKLQIDVPADVAAIAGVIIALDGQPQDPSSWGTPVPVDAMEHEITVTAPGWEPWTKRVFVGDSNKVDAAASSVVVKVGSPSLPRTSLSIEVSVEIARIPGVVIKLDGANVDLSEWADGAPIDAGSHDMSVSAPGYELWTKKFVVRKGESALISVQSLKKQSLPTPLQQSTSVDKPNQTFRFDKRTAGIVAMATGGASIGVGAILGTVAILKNGESNDGHCTKDDFCDDVGYALRAQALNLANASTTTVIVGGILAATGGVLIAVSPRRNVPSLGRSVSRGIKPTAAQLWIGPRTVGIECAW